MNLQELNKLVSGGQTDQVEFQRSTNERAEAAKSICAMLNGNGGVVLFGVTERGEVLGEWIVPGTLESIAQEIQKIDSPLTPEIESIPMAGGRSVVVVRVPGGGGPCTYDGRPYARMGPSTAVMPRSQYERSLLERLHTVRRWENEPAPEGISLDDLDEEEIQRTVDLAVGRGRLAPPNDRSVEAILRGFRLIANDRLLNAALVLFGRPRDLQVIAPQCMIRMARFRGDDRLAHVEDKRQYWGHAFDLLRHATAFLREYVPVASREAPGLPEREDRPRYPTRATREATANAIVHRDYANTGAIALAMYDDRLEITNPGRLSYGLNPEKLTGPHESRPWNPTIAEVFYRAGIIELWGTGTLNILAWCREGYTPPPVWEEWSETVVLNFFPARPFEEQDRPEFRPRSKPVSRPEFQPESQPLSKPESTSRRISRVQPESEVEVEEMEPESAVGPQPGSRSEKVPKRRIKLDNKAQVKQRPESKLALNASVVQPGSMVNRVLRVLERGPLSKSRIAEEIGQKSVSGQLKKVVQEMLVDQLIAYTIPDKPGSRLQEYILTPKGASQMRKGRR